MTIGNPQVFINSILETKEKFRGILRFKNGREEEMEIPGSVTDDGAVQIPETVTAFDTHFELDKFQDEEDGFTYSEVKNGVPFRMDLH